MERIGRYRVVRPLGRGGMGQVFLGQDPTLERKVALKLLHRDPTRTGLRDEAKALAALNHPNIVTIFEIGEHDDSEFIAMEYVPGTTLRGRLEDETPRAELLALCAQVAAGLAAAHRAGILHRDIKPENVLVGESGTVKVVDFGIAWRVDAHPSFGRAVSVADFVDALVPDCVDATIVSANTQSLFGTPLYMAPECLRGDAATEASDIYGLGVILYECVARKRPYAPTTLAELIDLVVHTSPARLEDPLGPLIARILDHDPDRRPSLREIGEALVPRAPVPPRRRWPILAGAAVVGAAVIATITWPRSDSEPATQAEQLVTAQIAVAPVVLDTKTYGGWDFPHREKTADAVADTVAMVKGARLDGIALVEVDRTKQVVAARAAGAKYLMTITGVERDGRVRAEVELVEVNGSFVHTHVVEDDVEHIARLLENAVLASARALAPEATLPSSSLLAQKLYAQGKPLADAAQFTDARAYLEQAVQADPQFGDAWYELALVLAWMEAADGRVSSAIEKAIQLAANDRKQQLMRGIALFYETKFADARRTLESLEKSGATERELVYYLGEANWHDGRHDAGFAYFKRMITHQSQFRPAVVHAMQYALARRDRTLGPLYVGMRGEDVGLLQIALGEYKEAAANASPHFRATALQILDQPVPPQLDGVVFQIPIDRAAYDIAIAAAKGDIAAARSRFAALWKTPPEPEGTVFYQLEYLGETLLVAGLRDEMRQVLAFLAEHSKQRVKRGLHRMTILLSGQNRDLSSIPTKGLSERETRLAEAVIADVTGDRSRAATILAELVANPTFIWDYPERFMLLRLYLETKQPARAAELCTDTMKPAIFRPAFHVLRRACRKQ